MKEPRSGIGMGELWPPPAADAPDAASRAAVPSAQPPSPLTLGHKLSVNN